MPNSNFPNTKFQMPDAARGRNFIGAGISKSEIQDDFKRPAPILFAKESWQL